MKSGRLITAALVLAISGAWTPVALADETATLVVLRGPATIDGARLDIEPELVEWFTDRPVHDAGDMTADQLADLWSRQLEASPPNAAITGDQANAVVTLTSFSTPGDAVSFDYEIITGELNDGDIGVISIFIDPIQETMTITEGP